eukprot:scaffold192738_cov37-Tisochrysis_lutea.AAC.1
MHATHIDVTSSTPSPLGARIRETSHVSVTTRSMWGAHLKPMRAEVTKTQPVIKMLSIDPKRQDQIAGAMVIALRSKELPDRTARSVSKNMAECRSEPINMAAEPPRAANGENPAALACCCVPNTLRPSPKHTMSTPAKRPVLSLLPRNTREIRAVQAGTELYRTAADEIHGHALQKETPNAAIVTKNVVRIRPLRCAREHAACCHAQHIAQCGHEQKLPPDSIVHSKVVHENRLDCAREDIAS